MSYKETLWLRFNYETSRAEYADHMGMLSTWAEYADHMGMLSTWAKTQGSIEFSWFQNITYHCTSRTVVKYRIISTVQPCYIDYRTR